jgi:hypothetical protein
MLKMDLKPDDVIRLRKKHPCGSNEWQVLQVGIDIRIKCLGCQRQILLDRLILESKVKALISRNGLVSEVDKVEHSE